MNYIKKFSEVSLDDIGLVGGKNASLGQMIQHLPADSVPIPHGFAITSVAYRHFLDANKLNDTLSAVLSGLKDGSDISKLKEVGAQARALIQQGTIPTDLADEIQRAYQELSALYRVDACDVAVRSSATAEDLPNASFAGQQESFLHIHGVDQLLQAYKACLASLFTDRAIAYRIENGFEHAQVALSVGVQKMVRSDKGAAGVMFTLDTESGFRDLVVINASYGLGEMVVKGLVTPDEYRVFKPLLEGSYAPIVVKNCGHKDRKLVYADTAAGTVTTQEVAVSQRDQQIFCLSDTQILELARTAVAIETYYSRQAGAWKPMDIEWALDGVEGTLYIVQARPETVHARETKSTTIKQYVLKRDSTLTELTRGQSVGTKIASGRARVIESYHDTIDFSDGDILVTTMTDPDWVPLMRKASAIVTERGGRTSHAAIVSRELGVPAVVGAQGVLEKIKDGQSITVDCAQGQTGYVYAGKLSYDVVTTSLEEIPKLPVKLMMNVADPEVVFQICSLPNDGVGLARMEFIISHMIGLHPMAAVSLEKVTDAKTRTQIEARAHAYGSVKEFFVATLAQGVGAIAAAFYPKPVIVRCSDFKSNEYRSLLGGTFFEVQEENPMLGFRGASRYYHPRYQEAFKLECAALEYARLRMGFTNIKVMVPFVRTVTEAQRVQECMQQAGLVRGKDGLEVLMMCEIPSNVILMEQFAQYYDGFSIGSNDLTQMTLGVDRDSEILKDLFDERDAAVQELIRLAIERAHVSKKPIGICGQGPSDYPELAHALIAQGIDSLSLNPDAIIPFLAAYKKSL